jgi:hypothetical protein
MLIQQASPGIAGNRRLRAEERDGVREPVVVDVVRGVEVDGLSGFDVVFEDPEVPFFGAGSGVGLTADFTLRRVT